MLINSVLTHMMTLHHADTFLRLTSEITLAHYRFCIEDQIDLNLFVCLMNLEMFSSFVLQTWHLLSSPPAWIDFAVWEKQRGKHNSTPYHFFPMVLCCCCSFHLPYVIESNLSSLRLPKPLLLTEQTLLCQNYLPFKIVNYIQLVFFAIFACIHQILSGKCYKTKTYFQHFRKLFR